MTPKEKAKQILLSYKYVLNDARIAKRCALISVDEMLNFRNALYINEGSLAHQYLLKVKQEIENL